MRKYWISLFSLLSIVLAGCGAAQVNSVETQATAKETDSTSMSSTSLPKYEDDMPKDPPLPIPANPGLQALIERAKADLAQRLSIQSSEIKAVETKDVAWPDPSLGCPQPGIAYAQIATPGYLIMFAYSGNEFEYHVDIRGNVVHCENPAPPISGTPANP